MTQIYFVRHAEPNYRNHDDQSRELSARGLEDRKLVTAFLLDKDIDAVLSSPYRRAVDTVRHFADTVRKPIEHIADFRERRVDSVWIDDFDDFCRKQWADFDYHLADGESLREVQTRNVTALQRVLQTHAGQRVVIGGHGTAISTILNHYDPSFGHAEFEAIRRLMPWIIRLDFDGDTFLSMERFNLKP
ncbi:MAG: histidine phosphatase family protein [Clostridia bacterium]|nr:histidine phosphatase family protein [Clostridia bacterium]